MQTVVILTPGFPKDENDTTCLPPIQQFVLSLKKLYPKNKIIVLSFQYPFQKKEYEWYGIKIVAIGGSNKSGIKRLITWFKAYRELIRIKKEEKVIGLLSLWLTECALLGKLFGKLNNLKHFIWLQAQDAKPNNQFVKRIRPKAGELIAISDFIQEVFYKNHGQKPFLIAENGINESIFQPLNVGERSIDVLGVGSLIKLKNYSLFVEIIEEVKRKFPNINAVIAGAGEEEPNLIKQVQKLNLQNHITFVGHVGHPKVLELMNNAKLFLHTSHYEGNSTVLAEALYSGCQTLSTQPLSNANVKNLNINKKKAEFISFIIEKLNDKKPLAERVVFNTMDNTAKKIMNLFLV